MSVKVVSTFVPENLPYGDPDKNGIRQAKEDFTFYFLCVIDGREGYLYFNHKKGLCYNGASNKLGWPIKNYYGVAKKDCAPNAHDDLYAWGGQVKGLKRKLSASECDDILRGAMREGGFSRKDAGIVDRAVKIPLVHWLHFGVKNDKEGMHNLCEICWINKDV